ncbi:hypothetical protein [Microbacterium sp. SORGH_AS_0862]|uniref:hypothetical protein n=1 Tax=Microbacterium sp. SORGH_AS_0862 TaxID=3041789 RepID=UPI00278F37E6|nr:hypothetical protein [Microbacterium sp. SORGH_AS_0862]MDQ1206233.1 uncharacterized protein YukE [Microbacterium sp. SORGH_AS_0862]
MGEYTVDPDALRAASSVIAGVADSAGGATLVSCVNVGHDGLTSAVSNFTQRLTSSWEERVDATERIAEGLVRTARIFEEADEEAASSATRINPGMF